MEKSPDFVVKGSFASLWNLTFAGVRTNESEAQSRVALAGAAYLGGFEYAELR